MFFIVFISKKLAFVASFLYYSFEVSFLFIDFKKTDKVKLAKIVICFYIVFFIVMFIPIGLDSIFGKKVNAHDWFNFYGSFFGTLLGIGFSYINTKLQLEQSKQNDLNNELKLKEIENLALLYNESTTLLVDIHNATAELLQYKINRKDKNYRFNKTFKIKDSLNRFLDFYNSHLAFINLEDAKLIREQVKDLKNKIDSFFYKNEKYLSNFNIEPRESFQISLGIHKDSLIMSDLAEQLSNSIKKIYEKAKSID